MKYYIKDYPKNNFYLLGHITPTGFSPGPGTKFIKEYLGDFPYFTDKLIAVDEVGRCTPVLDFLNKVKIP